MAKLSQTSYPLSRHRRAASTKLWVFLVFDTRCQCELAEK